MTMQQALEPGVIPVPELEQTEEDFVFISAAEDPIAAMTAAATPDTTPKEDKTPLIGEPGDTTVRLPGGYVDEKGQRYLTAEVRELTGEDEEALARAAAGGNPSRYAQVLLERGTVQVGPYPSTPVLISNLLAGDRDMLMLGIRCATYGTNIDVDVKCPVCGVEAHIQVLAKEDITVKPLEDVGPEYHIDLRAAHSAQVRLVLGSDINSLGDAEEATLAEQNTLLLSRCILSIDGIALKPGTALQRVKQLGMGDRRTILAFLNANQPGPNFEDVKYACTACGKEMTLALGIGDLFPR